MPTLINPLITDAGLNAAIAASGLGLQLAITHIALGDGQYNPTIGMTNMVNRKEKVAIASGYVSGSGGFRVNSLFPAWAGIPNPYNATEIGFWAGDPDAGGVLFAVYSHTSNVIVARNSLDYVVQFSMQLTRVPTGSVTVTVDPAASQALALLAAHESAGNPHTQYKHPPGAVTYFSASAAPTGFLKANGAAISRTTYADLFAVISTAYGVGDGSTTFNVPDLRGEFLRGFDDGRGVDTGRVIGSAQAGTNHPNVHAYATNSTTGSIVTPSMNAYGGYPDTNSPSSYDSIDIIGSSQYLSVALTLSGATTSGKYYRTRPRNVALLACIKY